MKKQVFYFVFPESGETITKKMNPLEIKSAAINYLEKQGILRGDLCVIKDCKEEVIAVAYAEDCKTKFFTEDEGIEITTIEPTKEISKKNE